MFFWLQRLQKMATPLKEGYYFGSASLNKKSLGLQRRSGHGWAKDRGGAGIGFREGVICIERKYVASDARILMCIRRGCHCCTPPPRCTLIRRSPGSSSFLLAGTKELHLIYWNFCTLPERSSTQQQPAYPFIYASKNRDRRITHLPAPDPQGSRCLDAKKFDSELSLHRKKRDCVPLRVVSFFCLANETSAILETRNTISWSSVARSIWNRE